MTDVFVSYKREDQDRVAPLVAALEKSGLDVWWDRELTGGSSWRQSIVQHLEAAKCAIVVWSENSVSAAGEFVHDEAGRAKARGVFLPVKIDKVDPPMGFGQVQALDLAGWNGNARDQRFQDVLAAAKALIAGGPRPVPKAPGRRFRLIALATSAFAATAAIASFASNVAGLQAPLCHIPGVHAACAQFGLGGIATPREQAAWNMRKPGDCQALRTFATQFPRGAYAQEADRRLRAAQTEIDETWTPADRRLPLTVRAAIDPSSNETAAKEDALKRSEEDLKIVCGPFADVDGFRLKSVRADPGRWRCLPLGSGVTCGFDGQAVCTIESRARTPREVCP